MNSLITEDERARINAVNSFWFPDGWNRHTLLTNEIYDIWFNETPQLDKLMGELFTEDLESIVRNQKEHWL